MTWISNLQIPGLTFKDMLYQRGHVISGTPGTTFDTDTLLGALWKHTGNKYDPNAFFKWFGKKKNRSQIHKSLIDGLPENLTYDGVQMPLSRIRLNAYTKTFEWYVSELLIQELKFITSGFRVHLNGAPNGGDYDVIGFSANELVYIETKAGKPNNIGFSDLRNFVARSEHLSSTISAIYVDFHDIQPFFKFDELLDAAKEDFLLEFREPGSSARLYRTAFAPRYVLENSAKGSVTNNLRFLFRTHYALESASLGSSLADAETLAKHYGFHVEWIMKGGKRTKIGRGS